MKIAVLKGGVSAERDVSLRSGAAVAQALQSKGYDVVEIDTQQSLIEQLEKIKPDAAYLALHGKFGEDGTIQSILEWLKIPYTGPSVSASALCYDKVMTKAVIKSLMNLRMPLGSACSRREGVKGWLQKNSLSPLPFPLIVKPSCEGSSIGVHRVYDVVSLEAALTEELKHHEEVLVEEMILGREVTVGVLNGKALPPVEVKPKSGFYDFKSKYTKGETEYIVPAILHESSDDTLAEACEAIYAFLKLEGAVRMDFMLKKNPQNSFEEAFFLEVNTIPGMTETSLLPKAAACVGISFPDLCDMVLKTARLKIT